MTLRTPSAWNPYTCPAELLGLSPCMSGFSYGGMGDHLKKRKTNPKQVQSSVWPIFYRHRILCRKMNNSKPHSFLKIPLTLWQLYQYPKLLSILTVVLYHKWQGMGNNQSKEVYSVTCVYKLQCFCCMPVSDVHSYGKVFVLLNFYLIMAPHKNDFRSNHLLACYW